MRGVTFDFNLLSSIPLELLTAAQKNRLMLAEAAGDLMTTNFAIGPDLQGRTPEGRARKEREERDKRFYEAVTAQLEERRTEFLRDLDRREQACNEALHENEEQLRGARKELQDIRDRAYEIYQADGSTAKVYRDGDKVRMESGTEVSRDIVKAEDLGDQRPSWSSYQEKTKRVDGLTTEREAIKEYHQKIGQARANAPDSGMTADERDELEQNLDRARPQSVAAHEAQSKLSTPDQDAAPKVRDMQKLSERFAAADRSEPATDAEPVLSDADFDTIRKPPAASSPALR